MKVMIIVLLATLVYTVSCASTAKPEEPSSTTSSVDEKKAKLMEKAKTLEKEAETEIKKLVAEGKTAAAAVLKKEEAQVKKLITELEAAKEAAVIKKIEHELTVAETKLKEQINKDKAGDLKSTVVRKASTKAQKATTVA